MTRALALAAAALAAAAAPAPAGARPAPAPAEAAAATVRAMVVGRTRVLRQARTVALRPRSVRVGGRRCAVGAATPLGVLAAARLRLRLRDYGSCGRSARDAAGLYVVRIGPDGERGSGGWVYKVGHRVGTASAGDPAGSFGTGRRLRGGDRVLWFWCRSAGSCQRTLEVVPERTDVAPGGSLRVTVRGYDDTGGARAVAGATVRLGSARAVTAGDGTATVAAPSTAGRARLVATMDGMIRSFPEVVSVR
jgi:hypothetical protein